MDTHTTLRHAARLHYAVLRRPLQVVDERVVQRYLDERSPARRSFESALGALDDAVKAWLGGFGDGPTEPVDVIKPPVVDEDEPAPDTDPEGGGEGEAEQIEHLTDDLLEQEETETFAGELAEDDELRQVQAELQAKRLIEEQQEREGGQDS